MLDFLLAARLIPLVAFMAGLAVVFRVRLKPAPVAVIGLGAAVFCIGTIVRLYLIPDSPIGYDYRIFWETGRDVWAGQNPYAADRFAAHQFLHPPTALPVFAAFALLPFDPSFITWTVLNIVTVLLLVPVAQLALRIPQHAASEELPFLATATLCIVLFASDAAFGNFYLGQLGIFAAVLCVAALEAQRRGRPILAGVCLALATVKIGTMLPFLLLFHRKADLWAWATFGASVVGLCLLGDRVADLPGRPATILEHIGELAAPGKVNDYSFEGPRSDTMIGFDHALYRLGLRDRRTIKIVQAVALLALGLWIAWLVVVRKIPHAAACSLVALYSMVFLYHRGYDAVILVIPLVYSTFHARTARGAARWLFTGAAVAVLLVLYLNDGLLRATRESSLTWGEWGRVPQAVVLPYATWLILLAMICLVLGTRALHTQAAASAVGVPVTSPKQEGAPV
jgi:hypothetical protein